MTTNYNLTVPQINLLLELFERPRVVVPGYRPLAPLINLSLARPIGGASTGSPSYELTGHGRALAQEIKQDRADAENAKLAIG